MNYPFWDVDIGYGILMASIAVIHVFVSHFAIGGGLYLVWAESVARRKSDQLRLEFLQKLSKFFVLLTVVFGALSGVGIWFIIGLLNPAATELLIRNFVWAWAIEWTFFAVEIAAAILYLYGWKRLTPRNHMIIGWIYFVSAWLSLFAINGIITFMLTPGAWLVTGSFWDGFFNPTMWSSLVLRTGICIMLAGLFAMMVASRYEANDFKARLMRYNATWAIVGLAVIAASLRWYWNAIPQTITDLATEAMPSVMESVWWSHLFLIAIGVMVVLFGLVFAKRQPFAIAIITLLLGLGWFGSYEWMREEIRKPYVIYDYMYANALELSKSEAYESDGMLSHIEFRTGDDGADLFRRACRSCHTIGGYRSLSSAYNGTDPDFIAGTIKGTEAMRGNMPPFMGTEDEASLIAAHIYKQIDQRHLSEIYGLSEAALGRKVYDVRCGRCHVLGGFNDKTESLVDLTDEDYTDLLDMAGDFADEMPPFTGDEIERAALIEFFKTIKEGGAE